ncbi:MAG: hypothetical protein U1E73_09735 [Planctomycetota bacterium]
MTLVDESLRSVPTAATRDAEEGGYLDRECARDRFCCLLRCGNPQCEDIVACVGEMHQEEDWRSGDWNLVTVFQPTLLKSLGGGRVAEKPGQQVDVPGVGPSTDDPGAFAPVMVPVKLDPTDETILKLLAETPRVRVLTSQVAQRLRREPKSIGKNLSKLCLARLIQNTPRRGYLITEMGSERASKGQ